MSLGNVTVSSPRRLLVVGSARRRLCCQNRDSLFTGLASRSCKMCDTLDTKVTVPVDEDVTGATSYVWTSTEVWTVPGSL